MPIELPPLRERTADIPAFVLHFLAKHASGRDRRYEISPGALTALQRHAWPGNVRELENLVERAVVLGAGPILGPEDLAPFSPSAIATTAGGDPRGPGHVDESHGLREAVRRAHGNLSLVARMLGIPRGTLLYRLRKHGLPTG